jgi:hypothetical protein
MTLDDTASDEARIRVLELQMESLIRRALLLVIVSGLALVVAAVAMVIALS